MERLAVMARSRQDYHQNYAERNALKYNYYRWACGRDNRLDQVWGENARTGKEWSKKD